MNKKEVLENNGEEVFYFTEGNRNRTVVKNSVIGNSLEKRTGNLTNNEVIEDPIMDTVAVLREGTITINGIIKKV